MNMYIGSHTLMKRYDECLLKHGYTIEQLVDKASDCLLKHIHGESFNIVCGPGNNGADGLSLAIKLYQQKKNVQVFIFETRIIFQKPMLIICRNVMICLFLFIYFNRII